MRQARERCGERSTLSRNGTIEVRASRNRRWRHRGCYQRTAARNASAFFSRTVIKGTNGNETPCQVWFQGQSPVIWQASLCGKGFHRLLQKKKKEYKHGARILHGVIILESYRNPQFRGRNLTGIITAGNCCARAWWLAPDGLMCERAETLSAVRQETIYQRPLTKLQYGVSFPPSDGSLWYRVKNMGPHETETSAKDRLNANTKVSWIIIIDTV